MRASKYTADNLSKRVVADLNSSVDDPTARAAPDDERSLLACIDHSPR
jgi:hypothetical protein